jgi:hypothetical protein
MANERAPEEVMAILDDLFSRIDALCTSSGVYKVREQR